MLLSGGKLALPAAAAKGFRAPRPLILAALALFAACAEGGSAPPSPSAPAAPPPSAPTLPSGPVDGAGRIAFYLDEAVCGDPVREAWASRQLALAGAAGAALASDRLASLLDRDPAAAERALAALDRDGAPRLPLPLLGRAAGSPDGQVRREAARVLGRSGDAGAVPWLLDLVGDGLDPVCMAALDALDRLGAEAGGRGLRGRYPDRLPASRQVRGLAVRVAGRTLPAGEAEAFLRSVVGEGDLELAAAAGRALVDRGIRAGWPEVLRRRIGDRGDSAEALRAWGALAAAGDGGAAARLGRFAREGAPDDAVEAIALLGAARSGAATDVLRALLGEEGFPGRAGEVMHALVGLADPAGDAAVLEQLRGGAEQRRLAARIIGSARRTDLAGDLASACATETDPGLRLTMASALGALRSPVGARAIGLVLLSDESEDAATALAAHNAATALLNLEEVPPDVLREIGEEGVASELPGIRLNVARVLSRGRGEETRSVLTRLLRDPAPSVREAAAVALGGRPDADPEALRAAFEAESDADARRALLTGARMVYYRWER